MSARLLAETDSAQGSLSENLTQLRESLESAGIQVETIEIGCRSFSSAEQGDGRNRQHIQQNAHAASAGSAAEIVTAAEESGDEDRLVNLQA